MVRDQLPIAGMAFSLSPPAAGMIPAVMNSAVKTAWMALKDLSRLMADCDKIEVLKDLVYLMCRTDSGLDG